LNYALSNSDLDVSSFELNTIDGSDIEIEVLNEKKN